MQITVVRETGNDLPTALIEGSHSVRAVAQQMFPHAVQQTNETLALRVQTFCIEFDYFVIVDRDGDRTFYVDTLGTTELAKVTTP
ncbi:hypothetical protein SEA_EVAA_85 [Gordonia phage Evaa]|nr:hypothetical protein SEA_EVAA_85 [Gordonia phage Evaa]